MKLLVVVDMQNDFVTGPLGSKRAEMIVPKIVEYIKGFDGDVAYTKDTHDSSYMSTQEGLNLPVPHCIKGYRGHEIVPEIQALIKPDDQVFEKPTFGSRELADMVREHHYEEIYLVGVCTGICVLNNAILIKAADPESQITVLKDLCGCVTKTTHQVALQAMNLSHIDIM